MLSHHRKSLGHVVGGVAVAATAALAAPALAAAEPIELTSPKVTTSVDGSTLSVNVANPNTDPTSSCGAFAVEASKLPALRDDPSKVTEPGFLSWQTATADRVGPGTDNTFTAKLNDGFYAVVGECVSASIPTPAIGEPQLLPVGGLLGSIDFGSLQSLSAGGIGGMLNGLPSGSVQPGA